MKIKPLKKYCSPKYPDRKIYIKNPEFLLKYSPLDWKSSKVITALLISFVLHAQNSNNQQIKIKDNAENILEKSVKNNNSEIKQQSSEFIIAPVFVHGDGRGSGGCMSIAPSVFLSEEDAINIIISEFDKENIKVEKKKISTKINIYKNVDLLDFNFDIMEKGIQVDKTYIKKADLNFDLFCPKYNLVTKFISSKNVENYDDGFEDGGSVWSFNTLRIARKIQSVCDIKSGYNVAVFYEPAVDYSAISKDPYQSGIEKKMLTADENLLRAQVSDFITWFKHEIKLREK